MGEAKRRMDAGLGFDSRALQANQQIQIDLKNATLKVCECGCKYFQSVSMAYIVSALVSPTGQELLAQRPILICLQCRMPIDLIGDKNIKSQA